MNTNNAAALELLELISREMRERRVNHGKHTSPTLVAWAARIDAELATLRATLAQPDATRPRAIWPDALSSPERHQLRVLLECVDRRVLSLHEADQLVNLIAAALTSQPSGEAVAWTVVGPDGKSSIGGWHDISTYEVAKKMAVLRDGHRYAFATHPSADAPGVAVDEWRTIESAPKDGTRIALVNAENGICATAEWQHWIVGDKHGLWVSWPYIHGYPTGWMPLPALTVSESNHHGA